MPYELRFWLGIGPTPYLAYAVLACLAFNRLIIIGGFVVCVSWLVVSLAATLQARITHAATMHLLKTGTWRDLEEARRNHLRQSMAWTAGALTPMLGLTGTAGLGLFVLVPVYGLLGRWVFERADFLVTRQEKLQFPGTATL
jgi:hypothetical protein